MEIGSSDTILISRLAGSKVVFCWNKKEKKDKFFFKITIKTLNKLNA